MTKKMVLQTPIARIEYCFLKCDTRKGYTGEFMLEEHRTKTHRKIITLHIMRLS